LIAVKCVNLGLQNNPAGLDSKIVMTGTSAE